jgi:hypothetical protein
VGARGVPQFNSDSLGFSRHVASVNLMTNQGYGDEVTVSWVVPQHRG